MDAWQIFDAAVNLDFEPVADGFVIPYVEGGVWAPECGRDIPLLCGSSADELGVFLPIEQLKEEPTWENLPEKVAEALHARRQKFSGTRIRKMPSRGMCLSTCCQWAMPSVGEPTIRLFTARLKAWPRSSVISLNMIPSRPCHPGCTAPGTRPTFLCSSE